MLIEQPIRYIRVNMIGLKGQRKTVGTLITQCQSTKRVNLYP
jgi:hypothetical protein